MSHLPKTNGSKIGPFVGIGFYVSIPNLRLEHDLIDPSQSHQCIDIVYPQLVDLIIEIGQ